PPTWADMQALVQNLDPKLFLLGQQHLRSAEGQVKNTTQPRLWLEVTLLGLLPSTVAGQVGGTPAIASSPVAGAIARPALPVNPPPTPAPLPTPTASVPPLPPTEATRGVAPGEQIPASTNGVMPGGQSPEPAVASNLPPHDAQNAPPHDPVATPEPNLDQLWLQVIAVLEPLGTRALMLQQGSLLFFDGVVARVGISSRPLFKMAQGRVENVEAAFQKVLSQKVQVSLEVLPDPKPEAPAPTIAPAASQEINQRPIPVELTAPPTSVAEPPAAVAQPDVNQPEVNPSLPAIASDFDRAVKNFAHFFNGQVVDLDDGPSLNPAPLKPSEAAAKQPSHPDKDVPF
ncbi:MAG: hypothetical protein WBG32_16495, partial [Nodosilinea sp.]